MLLAYYGDDFTGSTDALEVLTRAGVKTVLFIAPPTAAQLAQYPGIQAVGVAGRSRALAPGPMVEELRPAFLALRALGARHVHYKVCSTFDSSPKIGSIGCATDLGAQIFPAPFVPLVVGAPSLGRYCVFGNLFARMGIGSAGAIYRLDRHPSMSRHPVTPADESDLRLHLGKQTKRRIGLVDVLALAQPDEAAQAAVDARLAEGAQVILFDALTPEHHQKIGTLVEAAARRLAAPQAAPVEAAARRLAAPPSLFSIGSSGVEMALTAAATARGELAPITSWPNPGIATPLLIGSGSCSPVTAGQIAAALQAGFAEVLLDPAHPDERAAAESAAAHLATGRSVIVHTGGSAIQSNPLRGSSSRFDRLTEVGTLPAFRAEPRTDTKAAVASDLREPVEPATQPDPSSVSPEILGSALGRVLRAALALSPAVRRLVIAGGDTSSYVARALGIEAASMYAPLTPGAPLCRVRAPESPADGLEVSFKGGQVGPVDFFLAAQRGTLFP